MTTLLAPAPAPAFALSLSLAITLALAIGTPSRAAAQSVAQGQQDVKNGNEGDLGEIGEIGEIGEKTTGKTSRPAGAAGVSKSKRVEPKRVEPRRPPAGRNLERGYLGVVCNEPETRGRGVRISRIVPESPADKAGLQATDLIVGIGGVRVRQMVDLASILDEARPEASLTFEVLRGKDRKRIDVTFGYKPGTAPGGPAADGPNAAKGKAPAGDQPAPKVGDQPAPKVGDRPAPKLVDRLGLEPPGDNPTASKAPSPRRDADPPWETLLRRIEALERRIDSLERREVPAKR